MWYADIRAHRQEWYSVVLTETMEEIQNLFPVDKVASSWLVHQMETFSTLRDLCEGNSPATSEFLSKGQRRGALMLSLMCAWTNGWPNHRYAGDLRHRRAHYDITVMMESMTVQITYFINHAVRVLLCHCTWNNPALGSALLLNTPTALSNDIASLRNAVIPLVPRSFFTKPSTKDTPHLSRQGKLWNVFCGYICDTRYAISNHNGPYSKAFGLYLTQRMFAVTKGASSVFDWKWLWLHSLTLCSLNNIWRWSDCFLIEDVHFMLKQWTVTIWDFILYPAVKSRHKR